MNDTTDTALHNHVAVLTKPWSDVLGPKESGNGTYRPIDYPPLLDMLKQAIGSSLGKTQSGRSADAERSILNLKAFALYEHIDGTTRAWLRELSTMPAKENLKDAVAQLAGLLKALHASNQIPEQRRSHIIAQFGRWRQQIWELFDPPVVKDLIGNCPNCDEAHYTNMEGAIGTALIAYYWKGINPEAKCQCCGEHWVGESQLISLGKVLGATMDEDVLREMGAI